MLNFAHDTIEEKVNIFDLCIEKFPTQMTANKLIQFYFKGDIFPVFFEMKSEQEYRALKELWIHFFNYLETKIDILQSCEDGNNVLHLLFRKMPSYRYKKYEYKTETYEIIKNMYKEMTQFLIMRNKNWLYHENHKHQTPLEILLSKENDNTCFAYDLFNDLINFYSIDKEILKKYFLKSIKTSNCINIVDIFKIIQNYYETHNINIESIIDVETGNTILHYVTQKDLYTLSHQEAENFIEYLTRKKFNLNAKNKENLTALDYINKVNFILRQALKKHGAFTTGDELLFSKLIHFSILDNAIKGKIIERIISQIKDDQIKDISLFFDLIYPVEHRNSENSNHINHLINNFMDYHMHYPNESNALLGQEIDIIDQCISYFLPYSSYAAHKNQREKARGDWLLKIVQKYSEINLDLDNNENMEILFDAFTKKSLFCDLTQYNEMGENVFHLVARTGILSHFNAIIFSQVTYPTDNLYSALTATMQPKTGFTVNMNKTTPLKIAKKQYKTLKEPRYNTLISLIEEKVEEFKNKQ